MTSPCPQRGSEHQRSGPGHLTRDPEYGEAETMSDARENDRVEDEIGGGDYGPGAFDEPTTYRPEKGGPR